MHATGIRLIAPFVEGPLSVIFSSASALGSRTSLRCSAVTGYRFRAWCSDSLLRCHRNTQTFCCCLSNLLSAQRFRPALWHCAELVGLCNPLAFWRRVRSPLALREHAPFKLVLDARRCLLVVSSVLFSLLRMLQHALSLSVRCFRWHLLSGKRAAVNIVINGRDCCPSSAN